MDVRSELRGGDEHQTGDNTMQRRKLLAGLGSLAAGGAAAIGSGAFTSVEANRDISVAVADDSEAFLAIEPADTPNGDAYAEENGGTIELNFDGDADFSGINGTGGGSGLNDRALVIFEDVLTITNQGTQEVALGIDFGPEGWDDDYSGNLGAAAPTGDILRGDASRAGVTLEPGESIDTGIFFNLKKDENAADFLDDLETIIFYADADEA